MFCGFCGKEIPDNAEFCSYCGEKTIGDDVYNDETSVQVRQKSNKRAAAVVIPVAAVCLVIAVVTIFLNMQKGVEIIPGVTLGKPTGVWREMSRKGYDKDGNLLVSYEFERDDKGRIVKEEERDKAGVVKWHYSFEYNDDNTTKNMIRYNGENDIADYTQGSKTTFEYDEKKRCVRETALTWDGNTWKYHQAHEFFYDSDGKLSERRYYTFGFSGDDKSLISTCRYEYYDHETREYVTNEIFSKGFTQLTIRKHDGNDNLMEEIGYFGLSEDAPVSHTYKYERDSKGLLVRLKCIQNDNDGNYSYSKEEIYDHDQNGCISEETVNYKGGNYKYDTVIYKYEYSYYEVKPDDYKDYMIF